jgi:MscS family membrane protein
VRQSLANLAAIVVIISVAWLLVLFNGVVERRITRRIPVANLSATLSLLRVARRAGDVLVIFAAAIAILRHYGVNPTPILAGLGVGGIAVALAAQKTLENVIAGASLIFDQALRVGDAVRVGTFEGTVEHIGLRSTRIRTVDRTLVSLPNGLIANMSLETLSARDKFWFHPTIQLRYETTAAQLRDVVDGIRTMLEGEASVNREPLRVRFLRLGAFSIDIEVFAYVSARDWPHFLELQEQLLSRIMEIVAGAGAEIAFPSQTMYVERKPVAESA